MLGMDSTYRVEGLGPRVLGFLVGLAIGLLMLLLSLFDGLGPDSGAVVMIGLPSVVVAPLGGCLFGPAAVRASSTRGVALVVVALTLFSISVGAVVVGQAVELGSLRGHVTSDQVFGRIASGLTIAPVAC